MKKIAAALLLLFAASNIFASNLEKLFYLTTNDTTTSFNTEQLEQIKNHAKSINIIAPQVYQLDENGVIAGDIDPKLLILAKEKNIKLMPLIVNTNFDQEPFHKFLHNPAAEEKAISALLSLCKKYHLYGVQFDFENIHIKDKKEFTEFFQATAARFHQNGYTISIAVVPRTSDLFYSDFGQWYFENWSGVYDYQALGKSSDFISLMSYDQHTSLTTPGPVAPLDWVEKTLQNLLKVVPAKKISLGIPAYSYHWISGKLNPEKNIPEKYTFRSQAIPKAYPKVVDLLKQFHQPLIWQNQWQSSYAMFTNNEKNEYVFVENAKSFQAKVKLAKHFKLLGISVWKLGLEDPAIWKNL